jgi:hypothetical protein
MTDRQEHLTAFLASITAGRNVPVRAGGELQLDSLALLQVVTYLEHEYGIRLSDWDIEPDDLRSVAGILALIERCS